MRAYIRRYGLWVVMILAVLLLWGCGTKEYDTPEYNRESRDQESADGRADRDMMNSGRMGERFGNPESRTKNLLDGEPDSRQRNTGEISRDEENRWRVQLVHMAEKVRRVMVRRNYRIRQEKIRKILEDDMELPVRYDARETGRAAPVQDQKDLGTCWAFSSLLALENSLLPEESWDFSEDHMSHDKNFILGQENGGEYTMAMAYLLSWRGPVTEEQDPYGDGISPDNLEPVKHVQEVRILPEGDQEAIKRAVLACGGVQSSLYTTMQNGQSRSEHYNPETKAYCYPRKTAPNHDIVIVGWDDQFPKEAFRAEVPGDGAFLCENSWGTDFGDNGFFYVSYYDGNLGITNIVYTGVEEPDNYDRIYESDSCGWVGQLGYGEDTAWAANIYTAGQDERVEAAGFYATDKDTEYEIYVLHDMPPDASPALHAKGEPLAFGRLKYAGYYTISLKEPVEVKAEERFAVMIRLTTPNTIHPVAIEYDAGDGKSRIDLSDGEGYISFEGKYWVRAEEKQNCNICLKAYTCIRETARAQYAGQKGLK